MDSQVHGWLALWAADCAEHVLPRFEEERPTDARPRRAVEAGRAWARGEITMSQARAAATAHVATHAPHAAAYAVKAAAQTAGATSPSSAATEEREWQYRRLPEHLRPMAFPT